MITLKGISASPGFAKGTVFLHRAVALSDIPRYSIASHAVQDETNRLHDALAKSIEELEEIKSRVLREVGKKESGIFDAHLGLLQDQVFMDRIRTKVEEDLVNVEQALAQEIDAFEQIMASVGNEYFRERSMDLRDVGNRVIGHLQASEQKINRLSDLGPETVVLAEELFPSDTIDLDRSNVVGLATARGGFTSHAAILARALGIPAVIGVPKLMVKAEPGVMALIDGQHGTVTLDPSPRQVSRFAHRLTTYQRKLQVVLDEEDQECRLRDGTAIELLANINRPEEVDDAREHNLAGIGLFRTEFLYMQASSPPTVANHCRDYRRTARNAAGMSLTIRTFDLGGDKRPPFIAYHHESNPLLGLRGLRFALKERNMFRTQLRGILRTAKQCDNVRILFPMVIGRRDLHEALRRVEDMAAKEGLDKLPPVGAMIETPSAIFECADIMEIVDFVNIGTNDLVQYMLAADRTSMDVLPYDFTLNPSVLRAIEHVVRTGRARHCPVEVCGESAGDPVLASLLVGLGVRKLSMSPVRAPAVRYALRQMGSKELAEMATVALETEDEAAILKMLRGHFPESVKGLDD